MAVGKRQLHMVFASPFNNSNANAKCVIRSVLRVIENLSRSLSGNVREAIAQSVRAFCSSLSGVSA